SYAVSANTSASGATDTAGSARSWVWPGLLVGLALAAGALGTTAGPLRDVDVFWHVRLGNELLGGVSIYDVGRDWSYAPIDQPWVSTQWMIEILFSWLNTLFGWAGLVGYRAVTTAAALGTLVWTCFPRAKAVPTRTWSALVAFGLAVFTLLIFSQERPQQISFILLPLVGLWWLLAVRDGVAPRWWAMLVLAAIWSNCHGAWIMLPVALFLAVVGRWMNNGKSDPALRPLIYAFLAAIAGGSLTPIGPLNLLSPIRFAATTDQITEWEPTHMLALTSMGLTISGVLLAITWARGRSRPSRAEVLYAILILLFGSSAARNVTPAVLMLAPLVAWRLGTAFAGPRLAPAPKELRNVAKPAVAIVVVVGLFMTGFLVATTPIVTTETKPLDLVARIAAAPTPQRVLNGYDVSGLVLYYARPAVSRSLVQVGIDGRADRYGSAYINRYLDMERGRPGWEDTVAELKPTVALLPERDALIPLLKSRGWQVNGEQTKHVLLTPPGAPQMPK
ncbi:MAG: hypothetical protein WCI74_18360, partial [Actinomycetes bacterium]